MRRCRYHTSAWTSKMLEFQHFEQASLLMKEKTPAHHYSVVKSEFSLGVTQSIPWQNESQRFAQIVFAMNEVALSWSWAVASAGRRVARLLLEGDHVGCRSCRMAPGRSESSLGGLGSCVPLGFQFKSWLKYVWNILAFGIIFTLVTIIITLVTIIITLVPILFANSSLTYEVWLMKPAAMILESQCLQMPVWSSLAERRCVMIS